MPSGMFWYLQFKKIHKKPWEMTTDSKTWEVSQTSSYYIRCKKYEDEQKIFENLTPNNSSVLGDDWSKRHFHLTFFIRFHRRQAVEEVS